MSNANVQIVLDTGGNVDAKMREAAESVESLNTRVAGVGESLRSVFENLPSMLSGGAESIIGKVASGFGGLAEGASGAGAALGPVGIGLGVVATAAAAAVAVITGVVLALKSIDEAQTEVIAAQFRTAESLGVSTEALGGLEAEAKRVSGAMPEAVDTAVGKMLRTIGQAREGNAAASESFARLGLSVDQLAKQDAATALGEISDKIRGIADVSNQAAAAQDIFGRGGIELLGTLREGSAALNDVQAEALKYGYALSTADASKVFAAGEAVEEVGRRVEGLKNEITVALVPAVLQIGDWFQSVIPDAQHFGDVFSAALESIEIRAKQTWDVLRGVQAIVTLGTSGDIHGFSNAAGETDKVEEQWSKAQDKVAKAGEEASKRLGSAYAGAGAAMGDGLDTGADAAKRAEEAVKKLAEAKDRLKEAMDLTGFEGGKQENGAGAGVGTWLKDQGIDESKIKDVFDVAKAGGGDKDVMAAAEQAIQLQHQANADKAGKSLDDLREKLAALQGAAKEGIDSKAAEEIAKLHLDPDQAKQFSDLTKQIDALDEHSKALAKSAERITDLKAQIAAAQAGISVEDYKAQQADPASAGQIKSLEDQLDRTKQAKEAVKKIAEDIKRTAEEQQRKQDEDAKKAVEESLTPLQKEQEEIAKLKTLYDAGKISKEQYASAAATIAQKIHGEAHFTQDAATRGSQAAFKIIDEINGRQKKNEAEEIAKKQLEAQVQVPNLLGRLIDQGSKLLPLAMAAIGA